MIIKLCKDISVEKIEEIFVFYNEWVKVILNDCGIILIDLIFVKVIGILFILVGCICKLVMGFEYISVFMVGD